MLRDLLKLMLLIAALAAVMWLYGTWSAVESPRDFQEYASRNGLNLIPGTGTQIAYRDFHMVVPQGRVCFAYANSRCDNLPDACDPGHPAIDG